MMYRALLVFLVVLNLGVAAWWASREPAPPPAPEALPAGVPRLQLLSEAPETVRRAAASRVAAGTTATATQCVAFGPFANPAVLRRAHDLLAPQVQVARVRNVPVGTPTGWRVFLPPLASREAAQAVADRIVAAGIDDLFVMPSGPDRNGIALGRFGNEAAARRREAELKAAGFDAQVAPLGDVAVQGWIDVAAVPAFDAARAASDIAAPGTQTVDCATLR
jgi:hypothetical protein